MSNDASTVSASPELITAFLVLQLVGGVVALPILILTMIFAKSVRRHVTIINVLVTWMLSAIFNCLLFFAGNHLGPEPPFDLCLTQAALLYATNPMSATSAVVMLLQIWVILKSATSSSERFTPESLFQFLAPNTELGIFLISPYIVLIIWMLVTLFLGSANPQLVSRRLGVFYCVIKPSNFGVASAGFSAIMVLFALILSGIIGVKVYRIWKEAKAETVQVRNMNTGALDIFLLFRVAAFLSYAMIAFAASLISIWQPHVLFRFMFLATIPLAAFIIFATQEDVINVWLLRNTGGRTQITFKSLQNSVTVCMASGAKRTKNILALTPVRFKSKPDNFIQPPPSQLPSITHTPDSHGGIWIEYPRSTSSPSEFDLLPSRQSPSARITWAIPPNPKPFDPPG